MKLLCAIIVALFSTSSISLYADGGHKAHGADYGANGAEAYVSSPSSFDRDKFLNPYFLPFLEDVNNMILLDAGCGPGHFAIYAAEHGAKVYGFDINEQMIFSGINEVFKKGLMSKVILNVDDVQFLSYRSSFFDRAISINVAPNLPSSSVDTHFSEMQRVLKAGGEGIITVPISLDVVFTNNTQNDGKTFTEIERILKGLPDNPTSSDIYSNLMKLKDVVNATFVIKNSRLELVTDLNQLNEGQEIWRKLPVLVVPNYYHSEERYVSALKKVGFKIVKIEKPHFANEKERLKYNSSASPDMQFGSAYVKQGPYAIFWVKKS